MTDLGPLGEDLYEILGVKPDAPVDDIKKAYKKLAKENHPDRFMDPVEKEAAEERMAKITEARETLTDEEKRNEYDFMRKLQAGMAAGARQPEVSTEDKLKERKAKAEQFFQQAKDVRSRDPRKATAILEDAIKQDAENYFYYQTLGEIYFEMKMYTRARENVEKSIDKAGQQGQANYEAKSLLKKINTVSPPPAPSKAAPAAKGTPTPAGAKAGGGKDEKKGGLFGWLFGK